MAALLTFRTKSRSPGLQISAPTTNPTLTVSGTDLTPTVATSGFRRISIPPPPRRSSSPSAHSRTLSAPSVTQQATDLSASSPRSATSPIPTSPFSSSVHQSPASSVFADATGSDLEFNFPRPSDPEIDVLVESVKTTRNLVLLKHNLTYDEKWLILLSDARMRWRDDKKRVESDAARARSTANGQTPPLAVSSRASPDWYLKMLMKNEVTHENVASLYVSLRIKPPAWLAAFVSLQGIYLLALKLHQINTRVRSDEDILLEHEILKCLGILIDSKVGTVELIQQQHTINYITCSLSTSNIAARELVIDIICFCVYTSPGPDGVITALNSLSSINGYTGTFEYWFKSFSEALVRVDGQTASASDTVANEYTLMNIRFINALLDNVEDLDKRMHLRSQMDAAGLVKLLQRARELKFATINKQLDVYEEQAKNDRLSLRRRLDQSILRDMRDPQEVCRAILSTVEGSPAHAHFLSTMQHLLLIRAEGDQRVRIYQLIDALVSSIVFDGGAGFKDTPSDQIGVSVERLLAQFEEQDQARQTVVDVEIEQLRAELERVKGERDTLRDEVGMGASGQLGNFKAQLTGAEEKLRASGQMAQTLRMRLKEQKQGYEEHIRQLEMGFKEVYDMLQDAREPGMQTGMTDMSRAELVAALEKQVERKNALITLQHIRTRRAPKRKMNSRLARLEEEDIGAEGGSEDEDRGGNRAVDPNDDLRPQAFNVLAPAEPRLRDPGPPGIVTGMNDMASNLRPRRPLLVRRDATDMKVSIPAARSGLFVVPVDDATSPSCKVSPLHSDFESSESLSSEGAGVNSTILLDRWPPSFIDDSNSDDEPTTLDREYNAAALGQDDTRAPPDNDVDRQRYFSMLTFESGTVFDDGEPDHVVAKDAYYQDDDVASIRTFISQMF